MNSLQTFHYNTAEVRTVMRNGEAWFVAKDVCDVLDIKNPTQVVARLDEDERAMSDIGLKNGPANVISESGLYNVILRSDKPEAKRFKRWITHEVLPAIRKTGGYVSDDDMFINTYLSHADEQTKTLFRATLHSVRSLNAKIEADRPKVLFADAVSASDTSILIGQLAKLMRQNGREIGQNRLFGLLRDDGYLCSRGELWNLPTQRSMDLGLFEVCERTVGNPDGTISTTRTTVVTGKGQVYFINRYVGAARA